MPAFDATRLDLKKATRKAWAHTLGADRWGRSRGRITHAPTPGPGWCDVGGAAARSRRRTALSSSFVSKTERKFLPEAGTRRGRVLRAEAQSRFVLRPERHGALGLRLATFPHASAGDVLARPCTRRRLHRSNGAARGDSADVGHGQDARAFVGYEELRLRVSGDVCRRRRRRRDRAPRRGRAAPRARRHAPRSAAGASSSDALRALRLLFSASSASSLESVAPCKARVADVRLQQSVLSFKKKQPFRRRC